MRHTALKTLPVLAVTLASRAAFAGEEAGLPQLDTGTYPSQLFWLAVCFVSLYLLMWKMALPGVADVLETRRIKVGGDLDDAQRLSEDAGKVKTAYEKTLADAQKDAGEKMAAAGREVSDKISAEQSRFAEEARKRLAAAEQGIEKAKKDAMKSVAEVAADIAAEMAEKVAGIQATKADAKKAADAAMKG